MAFVDGFGTDNKLRDLTQWTAGFFNHKMPVHNGTGIKKIRRQRYMPAFSRISLNVAVGEQAFFGWFFIAPGQADDHDVNVRHTASIAAPCECAVSEADFKAVAIK